MNYFNLLFALLAHYTVRNNGTGTNILTHVGVVNLLQAIVRRIPYVPKLL